MLSHSLLYFFHDNCHKTVLCFYIHWIRFISCNIPVDIWSKHEAKKSKLVSNPTKMSHAQASGPWMLSRSCPCFDLAPKYVIFLWNQPQVGRPDRKIFCHPGASRHWGKNIRHFEQIGGHNLDFLSTFCLEFNGLYHLFGFNVTNNWNLVNRDHIGVCILTKCEPRSSVLVSWKNPIFSVFQNLQSWQRGHWRVI